MSKPKPAPLPSGTVVGGYQIVKKIAAGGFGIVYLAEDETRHLVALKEYLPASLADRSPGELIPRVKPEKQPLYRLGLKSFFEEGRSLAQISHASVVSDPVSSFTTRTPSRRICRTTSISSTGTIRSIT